MNKHDNNQKKLSREAIFPELLTPEVTAVLMITEVNKDESIAQE